MLILHNSLNQESVYKNLTKKISTVWLFQQATTTP